MGLLFILLPITAFNFVLAEPVEPIYKEETIPVDHLGTADARDILRRAKETQRNIDELVAKINQLRSSINDSALHSRANKVFDRLNAVSAILNSTTTYVQNLENSLEAANLTGKIAMYSSFLQCFARSHCVTTAGPTTTTTTPTTTTATAPPQECQSRTLTSSVTPELTNSPNYPKIVSHYNCTTKISAEVGNHVYLAVKSLTIDGEAYLEISDFDTGKLLKDRSTTYSDETFNTHAKNVEIRAYAGYHLGDGISYSIEYKSVNLCEGVDCENGTCIQEQDNTFHCVCNGCYILDEDGKCTLRDESRCNPSMQRRCGSFTNKGRCILEEDEDVPNGCRAVCQCIGSAPGETAKFCS